ncbi:MAG: hypothetical protein R3C39_03565 [Dehalococcoidia bacterium]
MSKLRDRIRDRTRQRPRALGFAVASSKDSAPNAAILVGVEVADVDAANAALEAGASALVYTGARDGLGAVVEAAGTTPVGMRIDAATADDTEALASASADFLIFDAGQTTATALLERRLGGVLLAPGDSSDDELRRFGPLDLDAVLVGAPSGELSVTGQLELRHLAEMVRAPLAILSERAVDAAVLEVWRDAGAVLVLLGAGAAGDAAALVEASREVRPPRQREEDKVQPLLPTPSAGHDHDDEDD